MEPFSTKNTKNGTEQNVDGTIEKKNERGTNDLAECPRSRTKRNDLKKSRNVPSPTVGLHKIRIPA